MMNHEEIKFRGQCRDTKKFYTGSLVKTDIGIGIVPPNSVDIQAASENKFLGNITCIIVKPETVGQFTGRKDINGKELYDGDIVRYTREKWRCPGHPLHLDNLTDICEVYWNKSEFAFWQRGNFPTGGGWSGTIQFYDDRASKNTFEIIGNIHENPELLK